MDLPSTESYMEVRVQDDPGVSEASGEPQSLVAKPRRFGEEPVQGCDPEAVA